MPLLCSQKTFRSRLCVYKNSLNHVLLMTVAFSISYIIKCCDNDDSGKANGVNDVANRSSDDGNDG